MRSRSDAGECCAYELTVSNCELSIKGPGRASQPAVVVGKLRPGRSHVSWVVEPAEMDLGGATADWKYRSWVLVDNEVQHEELPVERVSVAGLDWTEMELCVQSSVQAVVSNLFVFSSALTDLELHVLAASSMDPSHTPGAT